MWETQLSLTYRWHTSVRGFELVTGKDSIKGRGKMGYGYTFDHCHSPPLAWRWRRLLRVPPIWRNRARRSSGFGVDHSFCALVLRWPAFEPSVIKPAAAARYFLQTRSFRQYVETLQLRVRWHCRGLEQASVAHSLCLFKSMGGETAAS